MSASGGSEVAGRQRSARVHAHDAPAKRRRKDVVADAVDREEAVVRFRHQVLGGNSLSGDEVARWMESSPDGVDDLENLIHHLRQRCSVPWTHIQTVVFVTTGIVPRLLPVLANLDREPMSSSITRRIALSIDPTITPEVLMEEYRVLQKHFGVGRKAPALREEKPAKALFAWAHGLFDFADGPDEPKWAELRRRWNAASKGQGYDRKTPFVEEIRKALDWMLDPLAEHGGEDGDDDEAFVLEGLDPDLFLWVSDRQPLMLAAARFIAKVRWGGDQQTGDKEGP